MGSVYRRGNVLWIKYYRNGVAIRESAETDKEKVAKDLLKKREGDVVRGIPVTPRTNRVTFDELAEDVLNDYQVNGKKSLKDQERNLEHVLDTFKGWRAAAITTADIRKYIAKRQEEKAANGTINRELAAIGRAFSLGIDAAKVTHKPKIPKLKENNVRKGFFEAAQFKKLLANLPAAVQPAVRFLYITGWRVNSEVLPLQWRQVSFEAGTVRLDPGTTKNGEGRVFPMTAELRELLKAQRAFTDAVQKDKGEIIPYVFHRKGKPMAGFRKAWKTACKKAGCPGMIRHDFRRTAVRNLVRAGIPERVAMTMTGHKTRSVFERYNIVSEGDLAAAAARLDEVAGTIPGTGNHGVVGTVPEDQKESLATG